jgi:hypothetical protein
MQLDFNRYSACHGYSDQTLGPTMGHTSVQIWVQLTHENGLVIKAAKLKPSCSHVDWRKFCSHLESWNVRHLELLKLRN